MRCRCCNKEMQDYEMMSRNPRTGEYEDMCRTCINASRTFSAGPEVGITMDVPLLDILPNGPRSMDN